MTAFSHDVIGLYKLKWVTVVSQDFKDRALKTRIKEHERAVSQFDQYSKVAKHAEQYDHRIDFSNATIVNKTKHYRERLFLEAWYSLKDHNAGNDHIETPDVYKILIG